MPTTDNVGLFGYIDKGIVKNLILDGFVIGNYCVGSLAGRFNGTFSNIINNAKVTATGGNAGTYFGCGPCNYNIKLLSVPEVGGSVIGDGNFPPNTKTQITAIATDEYVFVNWTDIYENVISTENPFEVILISDTIIIANFLDTLGILEDDIFDISIVPNPTDNDFNIIFENTEEQKISINLIDLSGRHILDIFDGIVSAGTQTYPITTKLPSGTYLVKFVIAGKQVVRKVVVR